MGREYYSLGDLELILNSPPLVLCFAPPTHTVWHPPVILGMLKNGPSHVAETQ